MNAIPIEPDHQIFERLVVDAIKTLKFKVNGQLITATFRKIAVYKRKHVFLIKSGRPVEVSDDATETLILPFVFIMRYNRAIFATNGENRTPNGYLVDKLMVVRRHHK